MKDNLFLISVVLILLVGCDRSDIYSTPTKDVNNNGQLEPMFRMECINDKRTRSRVPMFKYGSTLILRTHNFNDGTHCFAGVSLDEKKVEWYLPNLHPDQCWMNEGYVYDNYFVVMSQSEVLTNGETTLYCFDLDTQTVVWSKDSWQNPSMPCDVVGHNDYCYHYEVQQECMRLIKTYVPTGESTILYENTTDTVLPNGRPTLTSVDGTLYLTFCMWDLEKDDNGQGSTMLLNVYDITNNKLTYQNYLPAAERVGAFVSEPKSDVIYINQGRTLYCFNFVKGEFVWINSNFDYELTHDVILLDNGDILRPAQGEMSYVSGTTGKIMWESRYDPNHDFIPMWTEVHGHYAYHYMSVYQNEVRDLNRNGELVAVLRYEKAQLKASIPAFMDDDGFIIVSKKEILKYPYVND